MEIDALRAFAHITGPLSPSAERAVARAKTLAQRALPDDEAARTTTQAAANQKARQAKTGVTLAIDPTSQLVVARVIDRVSGDVIRQIPSAEAVRFVTASREMFGQIADTKYKEAGSSGEPEPKNALTTDVTV